MFLILSYTSNEPTKANYGREYLFRQNINKNVNSDSYIGEQLYISYTYFYNFL